jgi:hypothetical protein
MTYLSETTMIGVEKAIQTSPSRIGAVGDTPPAAPKRAFIGEIGLAAMSA